MYPLRVSSNIGYNEQYKAYRKTARMAGKKKHKKTAHCIKKTGTKNSLASVQAYGLTSRSLKKRCVSARLKIISSIRSPSATEEGGSWNTQTSHNVTHHGPTLVRNGLHDKSTSTGVHLNTVQNTDRSRASSPLNTPMSHGRHGGHPCLKEHIHVTQNTPTSQEHMKDAHVKQK